VKTKLDLILNLPNPSQSPDRLENAITKITVLKDLHSLDQNLQVPKRSFICSTNLEARASISKFANWSKESFSDHNVLVAGLPDFSWSEHSKLGKNITNDHKLYQTAISYTKWP
jgi:hypothetical protein